MASILFARISVSLMKIITLNIRAKTDAISQSQFKLKTYHFEYIFSYL